MIHQVSNDNQSARPRDDVRDPDAHGQAAMLLVESLIHGLIGRSLLTVAEAVEIVGVAAEVKDKVAADLGESGATMAKSLALLGAIQSSLSLDLPRS